MHRFASLAVLAALALAGCTWADPAPRPTTGAPSGAGATEPAVEDPELHAFRAALEGGSPAEPEALVASIVAAGFDRTAIERTRELDSLGAPVTFVEIAVRVDDGCLLGQVGDGEPLAMRTAALGGERCLVGDVIALD